MKYDVIIIGSGLGGLECAHILSRQGMSVLVLEREVQPGGCMQSYPRRSASAPAGTKSLWYDTGLHYVGGLAEGQALHEKFKELNLLNLPWQRMDADGFNRVFIEGRNYHIAEGFDHFIDTLAADFPEERQGLRAYADILKKSLNVHDMENAAPLIEEGAWDFLNRTFSNPLLIDVISGTAQNMELRKESLPLFVFAHANASYIESSWRLRGDGNQLVHSLVNDIRQYGGEVLCRSEVEELIERDGQVVAARCTNGETYEGRFFISNAHPAITLDLVKQSQLIKPIFRRRMTSSKNTCGFLTVSLRLRTESLPYANYNQFVYRDRDVWEINRPDSPYIINGLMISYRTPEQGTFAEQIDLLTPVQWQLFEPWTNTTIGKRGQDYKDLKKRLANECIELAEHCMPGLSHMVDECYVSTPLTYRDYTLTPKGSAYGIRKDYHTPMFNIIPPVTTIPNLLLTGQNLIMHGIEGVTQTAFLTSSTLMKKWQGLQ
ncbi:MAG: NAD(P)/FAD-dependent oxidoreductase [Prevotella sp.]|nr:NAD(P)/FAD-dependent oxidoreductase [Prevotella sp.]